MADLVVLELPSPAASLPLATHARGALLCGSLRSLKRRALEAAYYRVLNPAFHDGMREIVATEWIPMAVALAHYEACDQLKLEAKVIDDIGAETSAFLNASFVQLLGRMAREGGATPLTVLSRLDRVCTRFWNGSAFRIVQRGPKDARVEWHGQPCGAVPYYRKAFRAYLGAILRPFAQTVSVQSVPATRGTVLVNHASWV